VTTEAELVTDTGMPGLAGLYRDTRVRLTDLAAGLDQAAHGAEVPACPGWAVRDVLAHLTAVPEDAIAGRLAGVPDEAFTADQVARFADVPVAEMLVRWSAAAPEFEEVIDAFGIWPAVIDVASHEQDIRGALGLAGARTCPAIREMAPRLASWLDPGVRMRIVTERGEYVLGDGQDEPSLTLSTTEFEMFRWRMGRRSPAQLAAMDWSADPAAVLGQLTIFGPATSDIVE
jgi:uncharacterized protein (TIGR03083 family)